MCSLCNLTSFGTQSCAAVRADGTASVPGRCRTVIAHVHVRAHVHLCAYVRVNICCAELRSARRRHCRSEGHWTHMGRPTSMSPGRRRRWTRDPCGGEQRNDGDGRWGYQDDAMLTPVRAPVASFSVRPSVRPSVPAALLVEPVEESLRLPPPSPDACLSAGLTCAHGQRHFRK